MSDTNLENQIYDDIEIKIWNSTLNEISYDLKHEHEHKRLNSVEEIAYDITDEIAYLIYNLQIV